MKYLPALVFSTIAMCCIVNETECWRSISSNQEDILGIRPQGRGQTQNQFVPPHQQIRNTAIPILLAIPVGNGIMLAIIPLPVTPMPLHRVAARHTLLPQPNEEEQ